jgi:hypothetical protein
MTSYDNNGYFGGNNGTPAPMPRGLTGRQLAGGIAYPEIGFSQVVQIPAGAPGSLVPTNTYVDIATITLNPGLWILSANISWDFNYVTGGTGTLHTIITDNSNTPLSGGATVGNGNGTGGTAPQAIYNSVFITTAPILVTASSVFKVRARRNDIAGVPATAQTLDILASGFTGYSSIQASIVG